MTVLETPRLLLRRWRPDDLKPFAELNADPRVMEYFPARLNLAETEAMIELIEKRVEQNGFGFWAMELKETGQLVGFTGLNVPGYPLPFSPCVEVGWRLAYPHWGKGLAPEAALASLQYGFERLGLTEVVAFTATGNLKSRRVMEKVGMVYNAQDDFAHPKLDASHPLSAHVLYRRRRDGT